MYYPMLFAILFFVLLVSSIKFIYDALHALEKLEKGTRPVSGIRTLTMRAFCAVSALCLVSLQLVSSVYCAPDCSGLRLLYYSILTAILG